jgi:hypothetical protein
MHRRKLGPQMIIKGQTSELQRMVGEHVHAIEQCAEWLLIVIGEEFDLVDPKPGDKRRCPRYGLHVVEDDWRFEVDGMQCSSLESLRMSFPYEEPISEVTFEDGILSVRTRSSVFTITPLFNPEAPSHESWRFLDDLESLEHPHDTEPLEMMEDDVICRWVSS